MSGFYVYILENQEGRLYIGQTTDVQRRLAEHNDPVGHEHLGKYTHKTGPWALIGSERYPTRSEAILRERQLKAWKSPKKVRMLFE